MEKKALVYILMSALFLQACQAIHPEDRGEDGFFLPMATQTSIALATWGASYRSTNQALQTQRADQHPTLTIFAVEPERVQDTIAALTRSPAQTPTQTMYLTPTQRVTPRLAPAASHADDFQLTFADISAILNFLLEANVQFQQARLEYIDRYEATEWLKMEDSIAFARLLAYELERTGYEHTLFPEAVLTLQLPDWENWLKEWCPDYFLSNIRCPAEAGLGRPEPFETLFMDAFISYVNQVDLALDAEKPIYGPAFTATAHRVELDHDPSAEWLLKVHAHMFGGTHWVPVDELPDGNYQRLHTDMHMTCSVWPYPTGEDYEDVFLDLTGDGLTDLITGFNEYVGGGGNVLSIQALKGTPSGFHLLKEIVDIYHSDSSSGEILSYRIDIPDDDSLPTLQVKEVQIFPWECQKEIITTYQWPNGVELVSVEEVERKDPECLLAKAIRAFPDKDFDQTTSEIEHALEVDKNTPLLTSEQKIFALYRLALLYSLMDDDTSARQHLESIRALARQTPSEFSDAITGEIDKLLDEPRLSPFSLCQVDNALALPSQDLSRYQMNYRYTGLEKAYPRPLCSMYWILEHVFEPLSLLPPSSFEAELRRMGAPIILAQPIDLATHDSAAWIFVAEYEDWRIVLRYDSQSGWQYDEFSDHVTTKPNEMIWINEDLTGDGQLDFALAFPIYLHPDSIMGISCPAGKGHALFVSTGIGNGWTINDWSTVCLDPDESLNLEDYLVDNNLDGMSDWIVELISSEEYDIDLGELILEPAPSAWRSIGYLTLREEGRIYPALTELEQKLVQGDNPAQIRREIEAFKQNLSVDELTFQGIQAYLKYITALSYELEGREREAIREYFELWMAAPGTLWSYLSSNRLAPVIDWEVP